MSLLRPTSVLRPQFIQSSAGRILISHFVPAEPSPERHALLCIPPFADEMNKSRHMLSLLARTLVGQSIECCLVDLFGTGDSEGDFGKASWQDWCNDVVAASTWLQQRGVSNISMLGLRSGALLAADLIQRQALSINTLVLWQPVVDGEVFLNQFLRLRLAAQMLGEKREASSTEALRYSLSQSESVEVAGYMLSADLAQSLNALKLIDLDIPHLKQVCWLELTTRQDASLRPASRAVLEHWQAQSARLTSAVIEGPAFWTTSEITQVPELIQATVDCLLGDRR